MSNPLTIQYMGAYQVIEDLIEKTTRPGHAGLTATEQLEDAQLCAAEYISWIDGTLTDGIAEPVGWSIRLSWLANIMGISVDRIERVLLPYLYESGYTAEDRNEIIDRVNRCNNGMLVELYEEISGEMVDIEGEA
jgi:hypothetical protein